MTEIEALERVFSAEIEGGPLYEKRVPAKLRRRLIDKGEIEAVEHSFSFGPFTATSPCLALTHRGRIRYCEWAASAPHAPGGG